MPSRSRSILLLEDNLADADFLQELLAETSDYQWQVFHYQRLAEALDHLNDRPFDLALLDLSLPDSQGLETVVRFCQQSRQLPVVVLTGVDDQDIALQVVAAGAQDYLVKGNITTDLLVRSIRYAIERGQILNRLQDSERRFRGVFEQTFQAMSLLTSAGIILETNQTVIHLSGFEAQTVKGQPIWQTRQWGYSPENQERLRAAVTEAANGQLVRFESQICNVENQLIWVDFSLKPIRDDQDRIVLLIAEARDISDRKQAEIEIQKALSKERELNQMKSSFITMVSHEFRTPMTVLSTAADLLQRFELAPEKRGKYFEQINDSVKTMLQLLDDILLLGRTEAGKLEFEPTDVDLEALCQEAVDISRMHTSSLHNIIFHYCGDSKLVCIDANLIHYILMNLISNAIKYSPQGGEVRLNVDLQGEIATFCIQDQGIGIPKIDQEHLFETFYRAKNVKQIKGTGLGLAIVKRCIDLHQGQIWVDSEENQGTSVTFKIKVGTQPKDDEREKERTGGRQARIENK